jgi:very-short-patch-repair endonuclease
MSNENYKRLHFVRLTSMAPGYKIILREGADVMNVEEFERKMKAIMAEYDSTATPKERKKPKPPKQKEINEERFDKKINEVEMILFAQNRMNDFRDQLSQIKKSAKLISKYYQYNVNEMLMQLELDLRGWKLGYQYRDEKNNARHDFYLHSLKLDVEIDEKHHQTPKQKEKDKIRDAKLGQKHVLRIPETILRTNLKLAADLIIVKIIRDRDYWLGEREIECLSKCGINFKPYVRLAREFKYL